MFFNRHFHFHPFWPNFNSDLWYFWSKIGNFDSKWVVLHSKIGSVVLEFFMPKSLISTFNVIHFIRKLLLFFWIRMSIFTLKTAIFEFLHQKVCFHRHKLCIDHSLRVNHDILMTVMYHLIGFLRNKWNDYFIFDHKSAYIKYRIQNI